MTKLANFSAPEGAAGQSGFDSARRTAAPHEPWLTASKLRHPCAQPRARNRPSRRKQMASRAASAENSMPLWLAAMTAWSLMPGSRVSATATEPSWALVETRETCPRPCGTVPAMTPTSARPVQHRNRAPAAPRTPERRGRPARCACREPRRCRAAASPCRRRAAPAAAGRRAAPAASTSAAQAVRHARGWARGQASRPDAASLCLGPRVTPW